MKEFEEWINDIGLVELALIGRNFTWRRGSQCSKLDRTLVDPQWIQRCNSLKLSSLKCSLSDHIPLLLESVEVNWGPKPFQNLDAWFTHPNFIKLVEDEWKNLGSMDVLSKLNRLKLPIRKWNKEKFGNFEFNIQRLEGELDVVVGRLDEGSSNEVDVARYNALKSQLEVWYERKQCY